MAQLTAPNSTSEGVTRLGRGALITASDLGPLADLVGTWIGSNGWELIAVPFQPASDPDPTFRVILRPYIEVITFSAIGAPVPDRGGKAGDMFLTGLMYDIRICDKVTDEPLHLENGMWLDQGPLGGDMPISRTAAIPHGDALLALGTAVTTEGPPTIPTPDGRADPGPKAPDGYLENYPIQQDGFFPSEPNKVLQEAIEGLTITQTTTLDVSTANGGGILNIPFVDQNAATTAFSATYWIETVETPTGPPVVQLQYSQQTNIEFIPQFTGNPDEKNLIMWPHVNLNTLHKQ